MQRAVQQFEMALQINPHDQIARNMLNQIRTANHKAPRSESRGTTRKEFLEIQSLVITLCAARGRLAQW